MLDRFRHLISDTLRILLFSTGLLVLRVGVGGMMLKHGWGKLASFGSLAGKFPDPIGLGSTFSLILAIFAEFLCSILVVLGVATRAAVVPLIVTMLVAAFVVHAGDPFAKRELALMYLTAFTTLAISGGGKFSLDYFILYRGRPETPE